MVIFTLSTPVVTLGVLIMLHLVVLSTAALNVYFGNTSLILMVLQFIRHEL